jgi:hypothetical protein
VSKVKRNCVRATERGKEAWSVNREPMNKNRIEGAAKQGECGFGNEPFITELEERAQPYLFKLRQSVGVKK